MDIGVSKLRHNLLTVGFSGEKGGRDRAVSRHRDQLRNYFVQCCGWYLGQTTVPPQAQWAAKWRGIPVGNSRESRQLGFVLQQLCDDPDRFGITSIRLEDDDWLDDFAAKLQGAPILCDLPSRSEEDRKTEYLVLCWMICVERGNATLQRCIRRAVQLGRQSTVIRQDAFFYLAAAILLMMRNARLTWFDEAIVSYRQKIADQAPEAQLPPGSQSWSGGRKGRNPLDEVTDQQLQDAFTALCGEQHGECNWLPDLLEPDAVLCRQIAALAQPRNNDYLYLLENYLDPSFPRDRIGFEYDSLKRLQAVFLEMELDVETGPDGKVPRMEDLTATPENTVDEDEEENAEGGKRKKEKKDADAVRSGKVPFRILRHTLNLLLGIRRDSLYGTESDLRDLLLRLGFACGMDHGELNRLLLDQEMAGIDFKTGPELLMAYFADRYYRKDQRPPEQPEAGFLPLNREVYSTVRLAQRIYDLLCAGNAAGSEGVTLRFTRYMDQLYRKDAGWNMEPKAFLAWMLDKKIPSQSYEKILSGGRWARRADHLVIYCGQLFRSRQALLNLKFYLGESLYRRSCARLAGEQAQAERQTAEREPQIREQQDKLKKLEKSGADGSLEQVIGKARDRLEALQQGQKALKKQVRALTKQQESLKAKHGEAANICMKEIRVLERVLNSVNQFGSLLGDSSQANAVLNQKIRLDSRERELLETFFPYDPDDRDYESFIVMDSHMEKGPRENWDEYLENKLDAICEAVNGDRMLSRDDYLCLLFAEYLVTYPDQHKGSALPPETDCIRQFAEEREEELLETRMQPFDPEKEPQMAGAFARSLRNYLANGESPAASNP